MIFAFGGCALFATSYYVVQRTWQARLFAAPAGRVHVLGLAAGDRGWPRSRCRWAITQSKEYAELEWPIDMLITAVWVAYAIVFFGTIVKRKTPHIYVANWFFGAYILTVAMLHIVNSAAMPVSLDQVVLGLRRRAGCDGAVVVRPQRGRLLPDRRASSA